MIPKWRMVRYTDDGCNLYQCLSCYKEWEGRDAPGWFSTAIDCDPGTPDAKHYTNRGKEVYYVDTEPRYMPDWHYCPLCGVKWTGPVRCNIDNDRMLGERRAWAYQARTWEVEDPGYWFVVMATDVYREGSNRKLSDREIPVERIHPCHGAKAALEHTRGKDVKRWETALQPGYYEEQFILRILTSAEVKVLPYLMQSYL